MKIEDEHVVEELKGAGWGAVWWTLAAILHVVAVLVLVYFTPLRHWFFSPEDPEAALAALKGLRMREITRQLVAAHTHHVRKTVAQQKRVLAEMQEIRDGRYKRYVEQAEKERRQNQKTPPPEPMAVLGSAGPDANIPLDDKDFFELYDIAQTVEKTTYGTYRQLRAAELARIQSLSLTEAGNATRVHVPGHPRVNIDVFYQDIERGNDPRLKALKDEILKVRIEVEEMLSAAMHMLDMAIGIQTADTLGTSIYGGPSGTAFEGGGSGRWGSAIGPNLRPEEFFPGNVDGDFGGGFRPLNGRKLMDDGRKAQWMYIDTWYVIGPFPNPNRMNIDKKFPPESMPGCRVDLDRTYIGKDGMKLQWEFRQGRSLMQVPYYVTNYAIWYAYTEVHADKEQDRWVIFGSDDYSRVWLNGKKIFSSGVTPHKWIPDRGWRKVHFRQGLNRMLLKVENAGGTMGYSVAVYLGEMPSGPAGS